MFDVSQPGYSAQLVYCDSINGSVLGFIITKAVSGASINALDTNKVSLWYEEKPVNALLLIA